MNREMLCGLILIIDTGILISVLMLLSSFPQEEMMANSSRTRMDSIRFFMALILFVGVCVFLFTF
jgi:hypothetical protein